MAFLIPALISLSSDILILWIRHTTPRSAGASYAADDEDRFVYHVRYLIPLAVLRMMLLAVPLLFHSYTGTAVQCPFFYRVLYWTTLLIVLWHMLMLAMVNPESLEAIFPVKEALTPLEDAVNYRFQEYQHHLVRFLLEHSHQLRRVWWTLLLSLLSDCCHLIIFSHVRSSAPSSYDYWSSSGTTGTYLRQPSVYYALRTGTITDGTHRNDAFYEDYGDGYTSRQTAWNGDNAEPALMHAMSEFMIDMRIRLNRAKKEWTARLEDFTATAAQQLTQNPFDQRGGSGNLSMQTTSAHSSTSPFFHHLSPFRVLLQLFAYEDVLDNGKLDAVFDMDDGAALTFYVPQLLSFLLHGALLCSPQLENWILDKCGRNIYFAHRCYWFLRAWCLQKHLKNGNGSDTAGTPLSSRSRNNSESHLRIGSGLAPFLDEPSPSQRGESVDCSRRSAGGNGTNGSHHPLQDAASQQFFLPEERQMIERLLMRVKECGEEAARVLAFGRRPPFVLHTSSTRSNDSSTVASTPSRYHRRRRVRSHGNAAEDNLSIGASFGASDFENINNNNDDDNNDEETVDDISSCRLFLTPNSMEDAAKKGLIPSHPGDDSPSVQHFRVLTAQRRHGFFPLDPESGSDSAALDRIGACNSGLKTTEQFDKTPQFLDALLNLADELFRVPRTNRRTELRKRLRALECEFLPSNAIYLPIGRMQHRVWRVAADESIALSTKERVPCIVCLEVIDIVPTRRQTRSHHQQGWTGFLDRLPRRIRRVNSLEDTLDGTEDPTTSVDLRAKAISSSPRLPAMMMEPFVSSSMTEPDLMKKWRDAPRDPLRRTSFINKVSTTVQNNVQVVQEHLNQYRDRTVSEELQSLTLQENLVLQSPSAPRELVNLSLWRDIEAPGGSNDQEEKAKSGATKSSGAEMPERTTTILSRSSSAGSLASMGQWSSPIPQEKYSRTMHLSERGSMSRRRMSRENFEDIVGGCTIGTLKYGSDSSDHEEDVASPSVRDVGVGEVSGITSSKAVLPKSGKPKPPPPVVFREGWKAKQERCRAASAYGSHPGWRLLPVLVKANDDLRQEQLASQLIYRMASILAREKVNVWLYPYEIIALTDSGGIIEAIPDTISLDSLRRNDPKFTTLKNFFHSHFGSAEELAGAKANFVESLAAYSIICFLLQIKDRHNGNILLDNRGHLIHIDFGFFFLSSPGKNAGFESAPFKLTREFVELLDGPTSHLFRSFRELCIKTFIALRRHCMELILLVEMLKNGNEELKCFRGRPDDAIQQLRERFRLDLNDRACREYVNSLVDDSIENWRTDWYDRYQRYFVGVL